MREARVYDVAFIQGPRSDGGDQRCGKTLRIGEKQKKGVVYYVVR